METQGVVIEPPLPVAGAIILPIAQVRTCFWHSAEGISAFCIKKPLYIIIIRNSAKKAFRMTGEELSLDQLKMECPQAAAPLEQY
jgi:hypothetical protein